MSTATEERTPVRRDTTVRTLLDLDREITRSGKGTAVRVTFGLMGALVLVVMYAATFAAEPGQARTTVACICCALAVLGYAFAPILTGVGNRGLSPTHVRHLPVPADEVRRALMFAALRRPGIAFLVLGVALGPLASLDTSGPAVATSVVIALLTAVVALAFSRAVVLTLEAATSTPTGRIIGAVVTTAVIGVGYATFILLSNAPTLFADNAVVGTVVRALPTGWSVPGADAVATGRWWVPVAAVVGLVALGAAALRWWTSGVATALEGAPPSGRTSRTRTRSGARTQRSPLVTILLVEASLLVKDPRRIGLFMLPAVFLFVGVMLMATSSDIYGMQYGAPLVVLICSTAFANSYGLDGFAFWRIAAVPGVARRVVTARMVLAAASAAVIGVVGTILGRTIGSPSPDTLPIAIAVVVSGTTGVAMISGLQSALSPYVVPGESATSGLNARGSMSGNAIGYSVGLMVAAGLLCAPGALAAALLPGASAWSGVILAVVIGAVAIRLAWTRAVRLATDRGPEIFAAVTP